MSAPASPRPRPRPARRRRAAPTPRSGALFERWCAARATVALDAPPAAIAACLAERAEWSKLATVRSAAAAIAAAGRAAGRPDPTKTPLVADTLRGIARQHAREPGAAPRQARALTYDQARELMLAACDRRRRGRGLESAATAIRRARVDARSSGCCSAGACGAPRPRRSSGPTSSRPSGTSNSASGSGRRRPTRRPSTTTSGCSWGRLHGRSRELRGAVGPADTDRVIPLSPYRINERLQVLAAHAGLAGVSSHSGRRGLAAELVRRGASTTAVQKGGGWRSPQMVARYASGVAVEDGAVARLFAGGGGSG